MSRIHWRAIRNPDPLAPVSDPTLVGPAAPVAQPRTPSLPKSLTPPRRRPATSNRAIPDPRTPEASSQAVDCCVRETVVPAHLGNFIEARRGTALTTDHFRIVALKHAFITGRARCDLTRTACTLCLHQQWGDPNSFVPGPSGFPRAEPPRPPLILSHERLNTGRGVWGLQRPLLGSETQPLARDSLGRLALPVVRVYAGLPSPLQRKTFLVDDSFQFGRVFWIGTGVVELILRQASHLR